MAKKEIGKVSHFFNKIMVAAIDLTDTLKVGDKISIEGAESKFEQTIDSMQIDNKSVEEAKAGESVGIKVIEKVHAGNKVFKVE